MGWKDGLGEGEQIAIRKGNFRWRPSWCCSSMTNRIQEHSALAAEVGLEDRDNLKAKLSEHVSGTSPGDL